MNDTALKTMFKQKTGGKAKASWAMLKKDALLMRGSPPFTILPSVEEMEKMFKEADSDKDGALNYEEYK